jgi:hypothetical protein
MQDGNGNDGFGSLFKKEKLKYVGTDLTRVARIGVEAFALGSKTLAKKHLQTLDGSDRFMARLTMVALRKICPDGKLNPVFASGVEVRPPAGRGDADRDKRGRVPTARGGAGGAALLPLPLPLPALAGNLDHVTGKAGGPSHIVAHS